MKEAGKIIYLILKFIKDLTIKGVTTEEINDICSIIIEKRGYISASLNYKKFPKSICTSINNIICHGIPKETKIKTGDIVNIDITILKNEWHADSSMIYYIGYVKSINIKKIIRVSIEVIKKAIKIVKKNTLMYKIGKIINCYSKRFNYSIVKNYCGHGIGKMFHTYPNIIHYYQKYNEEIIKKNMCFTIEPMINEGMYKTRILPDKWSVSTKDYTISIQFEHTIIVKVNKCEIFTQ